MVVNTVDLSTGTDTSDNPSGQPPFGNAQHDPAAARTRCEHLSAVATPAPAARQALCTRCPVVRLLAPAIPVPHRRCDRTYSWYLARVETCQRTS